MIILDSREKSHSPHNIHTLRIHSRDRFFSLYICCAPFYMRRETFTSPTVCGGGVTTQHIFIIPHICDIWGVGMMWGCVNMPLLPFGDARKLYIYIYANWFSLDRSSGSHDENRIAKPAGFVYRSLYMTRDAWLQGVYVSVICDRSEESAGKLKHCGVPSG